MAKLKGLGRGLDALLLGADEATGSDALKSLAIDRIRSGRYQPRTRMDDASLAELAESIKAQGVVQPILVRPIDAGRYEIVAGERRWRAAQRAGLKEISRDRNPSSPTRWARACGSSRLARAPAGS